MPPRGLHSIVNYLDRLKGRAPLPEVYELLKTSPVTPRDIEDRIRFDDQHCCRSVISHGQWHTLFMVCWRPGQGSPIHNYVGSSSAFKVLAGVCSETVFGFMGDGGVYPIENQVHETGAIVVAQDTDTHKISNQSGENLVTLHIHSPPLKALHTFAPIGRGWRKFPDIDDAALVGGSGI